MKLCRNRMFMRFKCQVFCAAGKIFSVRCFSEGTPVIEKYYLKLGDFVYFIEKTLAIQRRLKIISVLKRGAFSTLMYLSLWIYSCVSFCTAKQVEKSLIINSNIGCQEKP